MPVPAVPVSVPTNNETLSSTGHISNTNTNNLIIYPKAPLPNASLELKSTAIAPPVRHKKGTRPRGCPCCDPDNIDNVVDKLFFTNAPA